MSTLDEACAGPAAWLAYPLEAVYARLAPTGRSVEIICELVTGGRVEPGAERDLRLVRVVQEERQTEGPVSLRFLVDHSPTMRRAPRGAGRRGSCCGKDVSRA